MDNSAFVQLRSLLIFPDGCGCCPLTDAQLVALLRQYPDINDAAYHACIRMSRDTSLSLPDGMTIADQSEYWLRLAKTFRRSRSGSVKRADEEGGRDD